MNEAIRFVSTRPVDAGEELCIPFTPVELPEIMRPVQNGWVAESQNTWERLPGVSLDEINPYSGGRQRDVVSEADLPFSRTKVADRKSVV